jgi:osmotically inducible protein OsmC
MAESRASAVWAGDLVGGGGSVSVASGAFPEQAVTWAARTVRPDPKTSPEELIAAAHAACFSMALSAGLARQDTPAEELRTSATVTFQPGEGITRIALAVEGRVPGIDGVAFAEAAQAAKENCPVSKALAGVPEITLDAQLSA